MDSPFPVLLVGLAAGALLTRQRQANEPYMRGLVDGAQQGIAVLMFLLFGSILSVPVLIAVEAAFHPRPMATAAIGAGVAAVFAEIIMVKAG